MEEIDASWWLFFFLNSDEEFYWDANLWPTENTRYLGDLTENLKTRSRRRSAVVSENNNDLKKATTLINFKNVPKISYGLWNI